MKVLLMHPDRDFDPEGPLPPNADDLIQDLELNTLFGAMAQGDKFLFHTARRAILSSLTNLEEIRYRQAILRDCLKNAAIVREIYQIPIRATESKRRLWLGIYGSHPSSILSGAREMLEVYIGLLRDLRRIADFHAGKFESEGFRRFFAMVQEELSDAYLAAVDGHLKMLKFQDGILVSAELGPGNEGRNYILRKPNGGDNWIGRLVSRLTTPVYSYTLHPRDDHGARAMEELRSKGINRVANAVAQSADHVESFLKALQQELAFYIGCLNLAERLEQLEEPYTFPELAPAGERRLHCTGLYDVTLALTKNGKVVGNDVRGDGKDLLIITGANQGGKSTFLRSLGLAQLMMQSGMFVPAESFSGEMCTGLFTHYRRKEDPSMESGKLDEELGRMSRIVDLLTPDAVVLFNESFAATNEQEGSEIASQIVNALLERRIRVFFVTHLYHLARRFYEQGRHPALFLRAERKPDGERTFKLIEGVPLSTSYGPDLYHAIFEQADTPTVEIAGPVPN